MKISVKSLKESELRNLEIDIEGRRKELMKERGTTDLEEMKRILKFAKNQKLSVIFKDATKPLTGTYFGSDGHRHNIRDEKNKSHLFSLEDVQMIEELEPKVLKTSRASK